ncbi:MAG: type 1 glutamine amidotransferase domain-containing protein [Candidatus Brocadiae bacterium]|nr:type 1 glutamine amidotransferase domain-containing protein [Candidatus Brocadiia bacterium]
MRVLFVVSAAPCLTFSDRTVFPAGYWVPELVLPWEALLEDGRTLSLATPGGAPPIPDPQSMGKEQPRWMTRLARIAPLRKPAVLESVAAEPWDALVIPGGYAPAEDLPEHAATGLLLRSAMTRGAVVAAICHAPAAFLSARRPGEPWPFRGRRMTCFSEAEEAAWLGARRPARRVEFELRAEGAEVTVAAPWSAHCVVDGGLVTAQNSPSCAQFVEALRAALAIRAGGSSPSSGRPPAPHSPPPPAP